jgi:hypothetical protein
MMKERNGRSVPQRIDKTLIPQHAMTCKYYGKGNVGKQRNRWEESHIRPGQ